jgi:hypothetical protein
VKDELKELIGAMEAQANASSSESESAEVARLQDEVTHVKVCCIFFLLLI